MKKYPPIHHQENDYENIKRTIKAFPLATLISVSGKSACVTHVPLIYEDDGSPYGKLVGHMDKNNPKMDQLINYVAGFNIEILKWEGKFKLSQDKTEADRLGAKKALVKRSQSKIENFIMEVYKPQIG